MSLTTDRVKIENAVVELLKEVIDAGKTICFFDLNDFCASLKLSHLRKDQYHNEVSEVLTGKAVHQKFGDWVTCEYESSVRVLVQLAKAGELQSVCDEEKNHFAVYGSAGIRRSFPVKTTQIVVPANLTEEEAQKAVMQYADTKRNSGNVADLHDEDIRREEERNQKA